MQVEIPGIDGYFSRDNDRLKLSAYDDDKVYVGVKTRQQKSGKWEDVSASVNIQLEGAIVLHAVLGAYIEEERRKKATAEEEKRFVF